LRKQQWHQEILNVDDSCTIDVMGRPVRVMQKQALIAYKEKLSREVDTIDIEMIKSQC
jgi:hypothetical protein